MIKKKYSKELERIQSGLPDEIKQKLFYQKLISPTIREVFERTMNDETNSKEIRDKARDVLLTGALDETETTVDKEASIEANAYFDKEIDRSIKLGLLPAKLKDTLIKKICKKSKKESRIKQK